MLPNIHTAKNKFILKSRSPNIVVLLLINFQLQEKKKMYVEVLIRGLEETVSL
jgi:hypothetical protein